MPEVAQGAGRCMALLLAVMDGWGGEACGIAEGSLVEKKLRRTPTLIYISWWFRIQSHCQDECEDQADPIDQDLCRRVQPIKD